MLLLVTLTAAIVTSANAQVTYDNTVSPDFLLGFRQVGSTSSVLLDIGTLTDPNASQSFSLGNLATVLNATFGSGFATDGNLFFSLVSTNNGNSGLAPFTNFVTRSTSTPWTNLTGTNNTNLHNKITAMGNQYNTYSAQQTPGNPAVVESGGVNDYRLYMPGGTNDSGHAQGNISFGFFNPSTEVSFAGGVAAATLYLDRIGISPSTTQVFGTFSFSQDFSTLNYVAAIPEPSTCVMTVFGMAGLFVVCRRRLAKRDRTQAQLNG